MASFNRVILLGNVTRDIELRYVGSTNMAVTDIGLAVNDRRKTATGEWVEETTFVDITLWGRTAEIAGEYLTKGAPVFIEGRLKLDTWEKDGKKNSKLKVIGEKLQLLSGRGQTGGGGGGGGNGGAARPAARRPAGNTPQSAPEYDDGGDYGGDFDGGPPSGTSAGGGTSPGGAAPGGDEIPF